PLSNADAWPAKTGKAFFVDRLNNPNAQSAALDFSQGRNLRKLTLTARRASAFRSSCRIVKAGNPAGRPGEIIRIRFAEFPPQRWLFVKHDKEVLPGDNYCGVYEQRQGAEKQGLPKQRYQNTDVHWVSDEAVKSPSDHVFWRVNRRGRPFAR